MSIDQKTIQQTSYLIEVLKATLGRDLKHEEILIAGDTIKETSNLPEKSFEESIDRYVNVFFNKSADLYNSPIVENSSCNSISYISSATDYNNSNSHNSNCGARVGNLDDQIGWECSACSFNNTKFETQCEICSTKKVQPKSSVKTSGWDCKHCTFHNTEDASNCAMCMVNK